MKRNELKLATDVCIATTKDALQLLWDNINKGQRKQLYKREDIKALLDRYGVVICLVIGVIIRNAR